MLFSQPRFQWKIGILKKNFEKEYSRNQKIWFQISEKAHRRSKSSRFSFFENAFENVFKRRLRNDQALRNKSAMKLFLSEISLCFWKNSELCISQLKFLNFEPVRFECENRVFLNFDKNRTTHKIFVKISDFNLQFIYSSESPRNNVFSPYFAPNFTGKNRFFFYCIKNNNWLKCDLYRKSKLSELFDAFPILH